MGWREKALAKLDKATTKYVESTDPAERKEGGKRVRDAFAEIIREAARLEASLFKQKAVAGLYEKELTRGLVQVNLLAVLLASARGVDPENRFVKGGMANESGVWARRIQKLLEYSEFSAFGDVNWEPQGPRRPFWRRWLQRLGESLVRVGFGKEPKP